MYPTEATSPLNTTPSSAASPDNITPDSDCLLNRPYFSRNETEHYMALSRGNIPKTKEAVIRIQSCNFIRAMGEKLGFPQNTITTAMMLYHRFYLFHPLKEYPSNVKIYPQCFDISTTCVFVASKIEETYKKLKDILVAAYNVRHPLGPDINPDGQTLEEQRRRIIGYERLVLENIRFDFQIQQPHKFLVKFIKRLGGDKTLARKAWTIVNDAYKTTACLRFPAHVMAAASLWLAAKLLHMDFPPTMADGMKWTKLFCCKADDIEDIYMEPSGNADDPANAEFIRVKIILNQQAEARGAIACKES
ncbi:9529_t:CDS:2 [Paraglomus occultum]|uniref:9529_t:CDS:1 n=1 Tax=Paraglomus occultum TaxID=144539 RepID=A0A9N8W5H9_9GLOM|nr:9529_t:CDS:2 [Paraglomus occultum]